MAKSGARSVSTPNVVGNAGGGGARKSTHPDTRVIQPERAGQAGSAQAKDVPVPSQAAAHANRQKPDNTRVAVNLDTVGSETNESQQSSLQEPLDPAARVDTKH